MKARIGFVSNSSSSSFYCNCPDYREFIEKIGGLLEALCTEDNKPVPQALLKEIISSIRDMDYDE